MSYVVFFIGLLISSCTSSIISTDNADMTYLDSSKVIIVYLSRTKNTKAVAEIIQQKVGGKLISIELVNPYPENYQAMVAQVVRENEEDYLPPLKTKIDSIEKYDVVFVGFPTWDMKLPPPMKTFLTKHNLTGKTVVPFNTNAGYGVGSGFNKVSELCPKSNVLQGFETKGGIERDGILFVMKDEKAVQVEKEVTSWLRTLNLIAN